MDAIAVTVSSLLFADLERLSRLDLQFFDSLGDDWGDEHHASVRERISDAIAVPALDSCPIDASQGDLYRDVGYEARHVATANRCRSVFS